MQFLKFTVDEKLKSQQTGAPLDLQLILNSMPSINEGNFLFKNNGNLSFSNTTKDWGITSKNKSSGAAFADLDNDGDQDLIINSMNSTALLYKNTMAEKKQSAFAKIDLLKNNAGTNVIGSKIKAYSPGMVQYFEFMPVRGYQSSMITPMSIGMGKSLQLDSLNITWPDGKVFDIRNVKAGSVIEPAYAENKNQTANPSDIENSVPLFGAANLIVRLDPITLAGSQRVMPG